MSTGRHRSSLRLWCEAALWLIAFTGWVEWWFVPRWLAPRYRDPNATFRITTNNMGAVFDALPVAPARDRFVVVLVGDSTVSGIFGVGALAEPLRAALVPRAGGRPVEIIDLSLPGLFARDALFLVARALALEPDVLLVAVSPRVVPLAPAYPWATTVEDVALDRWILARVPLGTAFGLVDPRNIPRTFVYSFWPAARLRTALAEYLVTLLPAPVQLLAIATVAHPPAREPVEAIGTDSLKWTRARYGLAAASDSARAFDAILDVCRPEGRCLLYHVPVNPASSHGFEPGLVAEFLRDASDRARAAHVPFLDLRDAVPAAQFLQHSNGPDALHLQNDGAARLAQTLAPAVIAAGGLPRQ